MFSCFERRAFQVVFTEAAQDGDGNFFPLSVTVTKQLSERTVADEPRDLAGDPILDDQSEQIIGLPDGTTTTIWYGGESFSKSLPSTR